MKLKNKISGEIKEFALFDGDKLQDVAPYGQKRHRGRPRKSTEEKKRNRAIYRKKWRENMTEEQKEKRRKATRKSHDEWYSKHKEDWAAYMRMYMKRKRNEQKKEIKQ